MVSAELTDDGEAWIKYGDKKLLDAAYPRCVFFLFQDKQI